MWTTRACQQRYTLVAAKFNFYPVVIFFLSDLAYYQDFCKIFGMLYFLSSFDHPRLRYTLDLVLGQLLGLRYQLILLGEYKPAVHQPLINYSHLILKEGVSIPNAGLLKQKGVNRKKLKIVHGELPFLFYYSVSGTSYDLPFDVFSAVFYLVSDYEKYVSLEVDEHGRYRPDSYPTAELNLAEEPLVHHYVEFLRQLLIS